MSDLTALRLRVRREIRAGWWVLGLVIVGGVSGILAQPAQAGISLAAAIVAGGVVAAGLTLNYRVKRKLDWIAHGDR